MLLASYCNKDNPQG